MAKRSTGVGTILSVLFKATTPENLKTGVSYWNRVEKEVGSELRGFLTGLVVTAGLGAKEVAVESVEASVEASPANLIYNYFIK